MTSKDPDRGQKYVDMTPEVIESMVQDEIDRSDDVDIENVRLLDVQMLRENGKVRVYLESEGWESLGEGSNVHQLRL